VAETLCYQGRNRVTVDEQARLAAWSRQLGQILVEQGDWERAMRQFQLGLQYSEGREHKEVVRTCSEIGRLLWRQGRQQTSQHWTERALDLAENVLDPEELARLLYQAGTQYCSQGATRLAEKCWLRSLAICEQTGDLVLQARLYQSLGGQNKRTGDYTSALERLERATALAQECGDIVCLSQICRALSEIYSVLGEQGKAAASFREGNDLAEQAGLPRFILPTSDVLERCLSLPRAPNSSDPDAQVTPMAR
jgi:tetratricopeptide (TPR) repeat protein